MLRSSDGAPVIHSASAPQIAANCGAKSGEALPLQRSDRARPLIPLVSHSRQSRHPQRSRTPTNHTQDPTPTSASAHRNKMDRAASKAARMLTRIRAQRAQGPHRRELGSVVSRTRPTRQQVSVAEATSANPSTLVHKFGGSSMGGADVRGAACGCTGPVGIGSSLGCKGVGAIVAPRPRCHAF